MPLNGFWVSDWTIQMDNPGLRAKLVPASVVERPEIGVQITERRHGEDRSDKDGGRQVEGAMATGHVLSQRESRFVPRRDRR